MPALLAIWAGTISVAIFSFGSHSSACLLAPPPTMNRSGENSRSRWRRYFCTRLAHADHDSSSRLRALAAAFVSAS